MLREAEREYRKAAARVLNIVKAIEHKEAYEKLQAKNIQQLLEDQLLLSPTEASRRVQRARAFCPGMALTGEMLAPKLDLAAQAMRRGDLADSQLDAIRTVITRLPAHVDFQQRREAEAAMVEGAKHMDAGRLYRLGTRLHAYLDPDGAAPSDKDDAKPRRELHLHTGRDGRLALRGILDAETGSLLQEVLSPLAKPEGEDGKPDPRSAAERNGDALADILNLVADAGKLPIQGAERPHLTVTISWEMLRDCLDVARAYEGLTLSPETARRLACDADIIPVILNSEGVPLDVGRKERLAGPELRKALIARDKGCTRPGCTRPVRHTRAHHIVSWVDGGTTCLENCVLLCDRHHREIHHTDWTIRMNNGHPEFIPPLDVDYEQKPLRNTYHLYG